MPGLPMPLGGMGHIVFGAPAIDAFHLHERLARDLQRAGHRAEALHLDPVAATFWRAQTRPVVALLPERADPMQAPLDELAGDECRRLGIPAQSHAGRRRRARLTATMARWLPAMVRWCLGERPDLLVLHGRRALPQRLLQFVARECGVRVLWLGDGLLPHTLQCDDRGLDGDAGAARRPAYAYRDVVAAPGFLAGCLAHLLGAVRPSALPRREVVTPRLGTRWLDALHALVAGDVDGIRHALHGWQHALPRAPTPAVPFTLPDPPFVTVLLQDATDERLGLDADPAPDHGALIAAARAAAVALEPGLPLVVVAPPGGLRGATDWRRDRQACVVPPNAAAAAAATALATCTVNHPLGIAALLAGTPLLHCGRALYGLPGVTTMVPSAAFAEALPKALATANDTLRQRHLGWLLGHGHLWCSTTEPDHNGMVGLLQAIERRLGERRAVGQPLHYRAGPAWPLGRDHAG